MKKGFRAIPAVALAVGFFACPPPASAQWRRVGLEGKIVTAVAVDPTSGSILYAAAQLDGLWKSTDGGLNWSAARNGYSGDIAGSIAIEPSAPSTIFVGTNNGVFRSTDSGATWSDRTGNLPSRRIFAMAIDPGNPAVLYASVDAAGGGVYRSEDAGGSWTARPLPVPGSPVTSLAVRGAELFAGWGNVLWRSENGGANWAIPYPDVLPGGLFAIAAPDGEPDVVVGVNQRGTYRSTLSPSPNWISTRAGLTSLKITSLAVRPGETSTVFASASGGGGAFRSSDGGRSWAPVLAGLANTDVYALAFDPTGRFLHAGTGDGVFVVDLNASGCSEVSLCLNGGRFRVSVTWRAVHLGTSGVGHPVPIADDTGSFWFFGPANLELMIKVLDGRGFNGHFWVFFGALSDVEYEITVTDTANGTARTYRNEQGTLASVADTSAF
jgi:photosystem II stability/assembly factor-like uncharacterized protein